MAYKTMYIHLRSKRTRSDAEENLHSKQKRAKKEIIIPQRAEKEIIIPLGCSIGIETRTFALFNTSRFKIPTIDKDIYLDYLLMYCSTGAHVEQQKNRFTPCLGFAIQLQTYKYFLKNIFGVDNNILQQYKQTLEKVCHIEITSSCKLGSMWIIKMGWLEQEFSANEDLDTLLNFFNPPKNNTNAPKRLIRKQSQEMFDKRFQSNLNLYHFSKQFELEKKTPNERTIKCHYNSKSYEVKCEGNFAIYKKLGKNNIFNMSLLHIRQEKIRGLKEDEKQHTCRDAKFICFYLLFGMLRDINLVSTKFKDKEINDFLEEFIEKLYVTSYKDFEYTLMKNIFYEAMKEKMQSKIGVHSKDCVNYLFDFIIDHRYLPRLSTLKNHADLGMFY